ncbi:MAG: hypothetical protein H6807_06505 [Planctomycetes bacterium]|nr:hypothetical protein [Planctomycetota bacterium]
MLDGSREIELLADVLDGIEPLLLDAYVHGDLYVEADSQALVYGHLRGELPRADWIVRCEVPLGSARIDVAVFRRPAPEHLESFFCDPRSALAAAVEIKHASVIHQDLEKLRRYQQGRDDVLSWMVYSDHFIEAIYPDIFREQEERAKSIKDWVEEAPALRGASVVRLGDADVEPSSRERRVLDAFRNGWWSHG